MPTSISGPITGDGSSAKASPGHAIRPAAMHSTTSTATPPWHSVWANHWLSRNSAIPATDSASPPALRPFPATVSIARSSPACCATPRGEESSPVATSGAGAATQNRRICAGSRETTIAATRHRRSRGSTRFSHPIRQRCARSRRQTAHCSFTPLHRHAAAETGILRKSSARCAPQPLRGASFSVSRTTPSTAYPGLTSRNAAT